MYRDGKPSCSATDSKKLGMGETVKVLFGRPRRKAAPLRRPGGVDHLVNQQRAKSE